MIEKILIATDFSKYAEKIIDCAAEIPGAKEVVLVHVLARDPLARTWSPGDEEKAAAKKLDANKKALEEMGLKVKVRVEQAVEIEEYVVIERVAKEEGVSLVVMGARGKGLWRGLLLGSVSNDYLRYGSKDLLIMRYKTIGEAEQAELAKFCSLIFEKVLCPTDLSEAGNAAIDKIASEKLASDLILLNVVAAGEDPSRIEADLKGSQEKLDKMKESLGAAGLNVRASTLTTAAEGPRTYGSGGMVAVKSTPLAPVGGVVEKILSVAEGEDVSLIALGSRGKGWLDQATIGSVVSDVARMGSRPVLVVRSQKRS